MRGAEKDPVVHSSLSRPLVIASALLVLSMAWGIYDETYTIRPWKGYQARFVKLYARYLKTVAGGEAEVERQIKASPEYQRLDAGVRQAEKAALPGALEIDRKINTELEPKILALNDPFQEVRSQAGSLTYEIEVSHSESARNALRKEIEELLAGKREIALPGESRKRSMDFQAMSQQLLAWKDARARLLAQRVELMKPATALRVKRDQYLADRIPGASTSTIASLRNALAKFQIRIRQIHVKDVDLVDRCESCHLGTREPVNLTRASMGGEAVFTSHPNQELLKTHDPERFGCTPCHGGNGVALASVEKAHGYNKFWLWPLHHQENIEAGCQQCHATEAVTEMAETLNQGREIFRLRGCMACHRYQGFDREADEISSVSQQIRQLGRQKAEWRREAGFSEQNAANPRTTDGEARKLLAFANDLRVRSSGLDARIEQLDMRSRSLVREVKKVGPSLKEARVKLRKEWIPQWLNDPHQWRPGTKMPSFRLDDGEIRAISAFCGRPASRPNCRARIPATRPAARKPSKRAVAWPATPWAKARPNRAAPSPPT